MAGPTKKARLSSVLLTPFAAVSSCGLSTSEGVSASCAGRNAVPNRGASVASTNTTASGPSYSTTAAAASTRTVRARSQMTISFLRDIRSAIAEPNGATTAIIASRMVLQMPTAAAPPTSYAHTATAVA